MVCIALIPLLGQESRVGAVIGWSLVLIVLLIVGAAGVMWLRRWMKEQDLPTSTGGIGFTLSDLRQLHREGKMTDEEFERARSKMVSAGKRQADDLPDPLAGRRKPHQQRPGSTGAEGNPGGIGGGK
jgi:hypothetical protein